MGNRLGIEVISIIVALHKTVTSGVTLVGYQIFTSTVPSLCPVERVIGTIHYDTVVYIYRTSEEFYSIVRTLVALYIRNGSSIAYSIERESIGFVFSIELITCILKAEIPQNS